MKQARYSVRTSPDWVVLLDSDDFNAAYDDYRVRVSRFERVSLIDTQTGFTLATY